MNIDLAENSFEYNNEEKWFRLILKCTEIPSVNSAHGINTKTKVVYDMPWLTKFKQELSDQLIISDPRKHCPWIKDTPTFYLAMKFIIKHSMWSRDLDNMVKFTQDRIAEAIWINDSHIIENHVWKNFKEGDYEYVIAQLGASTYNYNQFR
jgi:Holliday junction resolvase RusA-like endonuclease